jgi:hypothetical protein
MNYLHCSGFLLTNLLCFSILADSAFATISDLTFQRGESLLVSQASSADVPAYPDQPGPDAIRPEFENPDAVPAPAPARPAMGRPASRRPALSWPMVNRSNASQPNRTQPASAQSSPMQSSPNESSSSVDPSMCPLTGEWEYIADSDFGYSPERGFFGGGPAYRAPVTITQENGKITMSGFFRASSGPGQGRRVPGQTKVTLPLQFGTGEVTMGTSDQGNGLEGQIVFSDGKPGNSTATIPFTMKRKTPLPPHLVCAGW